MGFGRLVRCAGTLLLAVSALAFGACSNAPETGEKMVSSSAAAPAPAVTASSSLPASSEESPAGGAVRIYLYGEQHGVEKILIAENERWEEHYEADHMRHLFLETPNYTAAYLNIWMKEDSDEILDQLYEDWEGTAAYNPYIKAFYQRIKRNCPETIFHGTDVGHSPATGKRYLQYLKDQNRADSVEYQDVEKVLEQGTYYYENQADSYRENKMVENFTYELDQLPGEKIMGIYGGAHIGLESMDTTGEVPSMANQLKNIYGDTIYSESLVWLAKVIPPLSVETLTVGGKDYEASYFGKEDLTGFKDYAYREFWRLENAYDDFQNNPKTGDQLPSNNYPMLIEDGQVFVVKMAKTDGSATQLYYRSDGVLREGEPSTEEFTVT